MVTLCSRVVFKTWQKDDLGEIWLRCYDNQKINKIDYFSYSHA